MQAYGASFARIYNQRWGSFAQGIGPRILDLYEQTPLGQSEHTLIDVCCGTGQLARIALERGYRVTGIDLSEAMLKYARDNNVDYIVSNQASFMQADASNFHVERQAGLVISTFDALNHLESFTALQSCFACVFAALKPGGTFVFDLNTHLGLTRWNGISIQDTDEIMLVNRGIFDEAHGRAYTQISGFLKREDGFYERFQETAYNTLFNLEDVRTSLLDCGWHQVYLAQYQDLLTPLENPEAEGRAFFIASK